MERPQKRQKVSAEPADAENATDEYDGEPTEFKLAILSSLHPDRSEDVLLDYLLAYDGSVIAATSALSAPEKRDTKKRNAINGYQSSLSAFAKPSEAADGSCATAKLLTKKGRTLHLYVRLDLAGCRRC